MTYEISHELLAPEGFKNSSGMGTASIYSCKGAKGIFQTMFHKDPYLMGEPLY